MKRPITKAHIRREMEQQITNFLNQGGEVVEVERGISGRTTNSPFKPDNTAFQQPKVGRTYIPEVVAAIDSRRNQKPVKPKPAKRKPYKKIIYDDFGEPLRWEWVES
ncbi:MAG: hypothetical protein V3T17_03595 [Pseudomonadales bacterium]